MSGRKKMKIEAKEYKVTDFNSSVLSTLSSCLQVPYGILLQGSAGCGKSSIVELFSRSHQKPLLTVFVDSAMDSKNLIGTYVCGEIPGEFEWKTGVLAYAALNGYWILFENLDRMNEDVLALVNNLLQTNKLVVPNRNEPIVPNEGFKVIATAADDIGDCKRWVVVKMDELRIKDYWQLFPINSIYAEYLKEVLLGIHLEMDSIGRKLGVNDWGKFARRCAYHIEKLYGKQGVVNNLLTEQCKELIMLEAVNVYSADKSPEKCLEVAARVLGLTLASAQAFYYNRCINLSNTASVFQVGVAPAIAISESLEISFALNNYTLRLLENLCSSVVFGENVLLIGETGCGKTSIIQHLAKLSNKKLYVHNLSQTSDPSDIIGGFKPIGVSSLLMPAIDYLFKKLPKLQDDLLSAEIKQTFGNKKWQKCLKLLIQAASALEQLDSSNNKIKKFSLMLTKVREKLKNSQFAFQFVEGSLVKALKEGSWVLLEEINLAEEEVLEMLYSVLESRGLTLLEKGEVHSIIPSPDFRLFGCMNPGRQAGKKDLPASLRSKFTEILVGEMDKFEDILSVIQFYLSGKVDRKTMEAIANFYISVRRLSAEGLLEDGAGRIPHFSPRTLCRALRYSVEFMSHYSFPVSLYNGLKVFFETSLQTSLEPLLTSLLPPPAHPLSTLTKTHINAFGFFHEPGPHPPRADTSFVLTPSVLKNLQNLSRASLYKNNSILLEGPTSSGKTSMIKHLAELLGREFIRINNHEHTDIEEYIGSYISDSQGRLVFCEGPLVKAVRNGHFLVLDELNLAPSEVLEALNRLLDDNHELFVNETQSLVKPHPLFRLFATQNPTAYAGRKELSKAFRNRFVEMFVPELPEAELVQILETKGKLAPSYALVLINVMKDLQRLRLQTRAFVGRQGFITIRDLLKIAKREPVGYEELAHFAYMILAERLRADEEMEVVKKVIEKHCKKVKIDMLKFYEEYFIKNYKKECTGIVWNRHMKRLFCLVNSAIVKNEPVLLVGETGCGKTSICQALAQHNSTNLKTLNCHQHTETADFLGSLRPIRNKSSLLADLHHHLQSFPSIFPNPSTLSIDDIQNTLKSLPHKPQELKDLYELSKKAMKLFEWVDGPLVECFDRGYFFLIDEISLADDSVLERLNSVLESERRLLVPEKAGDQHLEKEAVEGFQIFATMNPGGDYGKKELSPALRNRFTEIWVSIDIEDMCEIIRERLEDSSDLIAFIKDYNEKSRVPLSLRDALTCVEFMNANQMEDKLEEGLALVLPGKVSNDKGYEMIINENTLSVGPYSIGVKAGGKIDYAFRGPSVLRNLYSILRGMQMNKAILLEGPPGVGKTSMLEALGKVIGQSVVRVNLSEETDLIDLLGCDLPAGDKFLWCDGVLLDAVKTGKWLILDELNLCPQQVIEGLNSLLDHRASVFIPEINQEIICAKGFRLFAAQNPVSQGGGRKGLPKSFLNRFTKIYMEELKQEDYLCILNEIFEKDDNSGIVKFSEYMNAEIEGPWEFNLRDMLRFKANSDILSLYYGRLRTIQQRESCLICYEKAFGTTLQIEEAPFYRITPDGVIISNKSFIPESVCNLELIPRQLAILNRVLSAITNNWPLLLVGQQCSGKTSIVRIASWLLNANLVEISLSPNTDSSQILGSFEQSEHGRFDWFESSLIKAISSGSWVLLKNCNRCPAAVLDRINSLLEPNGSLLINERGLINGESYIIKPHGSFRIIFTYDSAFGEVSRALRNRCVEIFIENDYEYLDYNRIFQMTENEFSGIKGAGLGAVSKWKDLSKVVGRSKAFQIIYQLETNEILTDQGLIFENLRNFISNSLEAYWKEDLQFLKAYQHPEAIECVISNSCVSDIQARASYLSLPQVVSYIKTLPSSNPYLPILNLQDSLASYLTVSLLTSNYSGDFPSDLPHFWLLQHCTHSATQYKLSKSLPPPFSTPAPMPIGLFKSWKARHFQPLCRAPDLKNFPKLLTAFEFSQISAGKNFSITNNRKLVKVVDEDFNELEIGVLLSKESYQSEERVFLEEVKELFEQVLFRDFIRKIDCEERPEPGLGYYPQCYLWALWVVRQKKFEMRDVAMPILRNKQVKIVDFWEIFCRIKEVSVLEAPKYWSIGTSMVKWPRSKGNELPMKYFEELQIELEKFGEKDAVIDRLLCGETEDKKCIGLGLWLYKLYRGLEIDPMQVYADQLEDYHRIAQIIQRNLEIRVAYHRFRCGYPWESSLVRFYKESLTGFATKVTKISSKLSPSAADTQSFLKDLITFPQYQRLCTLLLQDFTPDSLNFLTQYLIGLSTSLETYSTTLSIPLLESLYLILFGLSIFKTCSVEVDPFPIPLPIYNNSLIKSHLFTTQEFLPSLLDAVNRVSSQSEYEKKLQIKQVSEFKSVHTVGEKEKEIDDKEYEENLTRQVAKVFPSYKDDRIWKDACLEQKKEIIGLVSDWEFGCGLHPESLKQRFLDSLPCAFPGPTLEKPLEIHLITYLQKYDTPLVNFSFYRDPNPYETMQSYTPLTQMLSKLSDLSSLFPGHAILQDLQQLIYRILKKHLFKTPLVQIAAALDILVQRAENWESFAHSGITLKKETAEIYTVLKRWRELELKSWEGVMNDYKRQAEEKDSKLWARLLRVVFLQKTEGKELFDALDEYLRGSRLGVFEYRLRVVKQLIRFASSGQKKAIWNIYTYFNGFFDNFYRIFEERQKEVQEKLQEVLKVAKFKVANYLLWRDSVQKMQRQLMQVINKYKTVLKLSFQTEVLEKHWRAYEVNVIEEGVKLLDDNDDENAYEELCSEIFERLKELKSQSDQSVKRLALADLFKSLKSLGFSPYTKTWDHKLHEMPILTPPSGIEIDKAEKYFYGSIDKITVLQFSFSKNHDLLPEEKEKCLAFINDMFNKLMEIRSKISEEFSHYESSIRTPEALNTLLCNIHTYLKSCKFELLQSTITSLEPAILPLPPLTNTLADISALTASLNYLSTHQSYSSQASAQLSFLPPAEPLHFSSFFLKPYKSLSKLTYLILSIFLSLFNQGFCIPQDLEEDTSGGDGTGLGQGRGSQNITNELEDEEQFGENGEQGNNEENSESIKDDEDAMDVKEDFGEDQEGSAEGSEGEDKLEEAKGNEELMDKDQEVEEKEGEVRESANPQMAGEADMKEGELPEDREGDVEDFEMKGCSSEEEETPEDEEESDEVIEIDEKLKDETGSERLSEADSKELSEQEDLQEDLEPKSQDEEEKNKTEKIEEEEKRLEEFKSRSMMKYEKEAYGNNDMSANAENMIDGNEDNQKQGTEQNIISKLRNEWKDSRQNPSELGMDAAQDSQKTVNKAQVVNTEDMDIDEPESSNLFTFNEKNANVAEAPSKENKESLSKTPIELSKNPHTTTSDSEPHKGSDNKETIEDSQDNLLHSTFSFIPFEPGKVSFTQKPSSSMHPDILVSLPSSKIEILPQLPGLDTEEWLDLERQTCKIASDLSEQLRIILEPTKAKSLKGDYKTGKRINMKKVIAFIASSFRKDKIWLRRTRETGRDYQVLIAIDDSFSMNQHNLGKIAKKGLAAIAQALNKLEVGELAVGAIRSGLTLLHDFTSSISSETGAFILSELQFQYGRDTGNDLAFPNFILQTQEFLSSRPCNSSQLVIIISDGRMNKQKVRPYLRKSEGIFYLFIIVDNQSSSILEMKSTVIDKVNGKSNVKVYPYLEDFPFEYYVVVQSSELLVNVLADVVKQWFELIRVR